MNFAKFMGFSRLIFRWKLCEREKWNLGVDKSGEKGYNWGGFIKVWKRKSAFHATFPTDARTAARRAVRFWCSVFVIRQRTNQANGLKGLMPLRNPQNLFLLLSFGGYQKALWHLQSLRQRIKDPLPIASRRFLLASLRAALQSKQRRKTYIFFLHFSPHIHHARQARKARAFLLDILLNRGA